MFKDISLKTFGEDARFWGIWLAVTLGTVAVRAAVFGLILYSRNFDAHYIYGYVHGSEPEAFYIISASAIGFIYGALIGSLQWAVLRKRIDAARMWMLACMLGSMVGWVLTTYLPGAFDTQVDFIVYPLVVSGVVMAVGQAWILRDFILPALWWVLASIIPWALLEYANQLSKFAGIEDFTIPLMIFSAMLIAAAAVYVFGQTGQRKFNALALGGISLLVIIIWGLLAKI